ncbi:hypothetical protein QRO11_08900 [Paracidovorax citrulli]|uniref:Transmembrane protein n=2 Tax=Paracidovorax citrulli TaxID=80869 RepID=A1TPA3_PARC0|nr:hypothetical protein [Paracidovorax citrulli]ABM32791.1 conserved hypothetical protein [Paracidovorax citrulli AAC00-1]ATG93220.1 hypothetical protein CQB05_03500 [Paracidovorax citrulli]MVT36856.1 hypothetical protein [Paracidovorax citrulli]PVY67008.1 hypothetical protein C8E08_4437 [Paracidovorax citrulli]QCX12856.1 hypothetical protein APS58_4154 [Paracidovorax citrulli]
MPLSLFASPRFLPRVLWVDAAGCAAAGAVQCAAAGPLGAATGLPAALLSATGWFLLAYAAAAAWIATRRRMPRAPIFLLATGNLGWAVGCIALAFAGPWDLPGYGVAWLMAQGAFALVLGELQWMGLRHQDPAGFAAGQPRTA